MNALALLRLQIEWGADEALEDAPVDRLRTNPPPLPPAALPPALAPASGPAPALPPPLTPGVAARTPAERAAAAAGRAAASTNCARRWLHSTAVPCAIPPPTWCLPRETRMRT